MYRALCVRTVNCVTIHTCLDSNTIVCKIRICRVISANADKRVEFFRSNILGKQWIENLTFKDHQQRIKISVLRENNDFITISTRGGAIFVGTLHVDEILHLSDRMWPFSPVIGWHYQHVSSSLCLQFPVAPTTSTHIRDVPI